MQIGDVKTLNAVVSAAESSFYLLRDEIESEKQLTIYCEKSPAMNCLQIVFEWVRGYKPHEAPEPDEPVFDYQKVFIPYGCDHHKVVKDVLDVLENIYNLELEEMYEFSFD